MVRYLDIYDSILYSMYVLKSFYEVFYFKVFL